MSTTAAALILDRLFVSEGQGQKEWNLPVRFERADVSSKDPAHHTIHGTSLLDGAPVETAFRPDSREGKAYTMPTVIQTARKLKAGGIIRFDGWIGAEGIATAHWPTILTHNEEEGRVIVGFCRARPVKRDLDGTQKGKAKIGIEHIDPTVAVRIDHLDGLKAELAALFADTERPGSPAAYLRVAVGPSAKAGWLIARLSEGAWLSPEESVRMCLPIRELDGIGGALKAGACVELIPARLYQVGPASVAGFIKNDALPERFYGPHGKSEPPRFSQGSFNLFPPRLGSRSHFVSEIKPILDGDSATSIEDIATPHRAGRS
jgi:hypothetical protein